MKTLLKHCNESELELDKIQEADALLNTIVVPKNLKALDKVLPKPICVAASYER